MSLATIPRRIAGAKSASGNRFIHEGTFALTQNWTLTDDESSPNTIIHVDEANQRIGIGTASPGNALHVDVDNSDYAAKIKNGSSGYGLSIICDSSSSSLYGLQVANNTSAYSLCVRNDGNVGIGTASPADKLTIYKASGSNYAGILSDSLASGEATQFYTLGKKSGGGNRYCAVAVQYIDQSSSGGSNEAVGYMYMSQGDGDIQYFWSDNTGAFRTSITGTQVGTTSGTVVGDQTSDVRLKNVLGECQYGLSEILKLETKSFTFKNDKTETKHVGFIAQQAREIIPESVYDTGEKIEGADHTKLAMRYYEIVPVLVNAVKDQQKIIESQNEKINNLQSQINEIKEMLK